MTLPAELRDRILVGDVRERIAALPDESVHTVVTSPPYWGLRDYGIDGQIGHERTVELYIETLVDVFRDVRRVLRKDGTLWLNMGDSYASPGRGPIGKSAKLTTRGESWEESRKATEALKHKAVQPWPRKQIVGQPWRLAIALQESGWILRSDIIWHKPNPLPESVRDRPTRAHDYVFLMARHPRYFYDRWSLSTPVVKSTELRIDQQIDRQQGSLRANGGVRDDRPMKAVTSPGGRANARTVWQIAHEGFYRGHFATFPLKLAQSCIDGGTSAHGACSECGAQWVRQYSDPKGTSWRDHGPADAVEGARSKSGRKHVLRALRMPVPVGWQASCTCGAEVEPAIVLDPFMGAGTVALAATMSLRTFVGIEISPEYAAMAEERLREQVPLFAAEEILR